jgi:hypothetical protein
MAVSAGRLRIAADNAAVDAHATCR